MLPPILALCLLARAPLLFEGWRFKVFLLYPPEKVKADEEVEASGRAEAVRLFAAKGERESFVILIRSRVPLREVTFEATDLRAEGGGRIVKGQLNFRRMAYVYVDTPSGTGMRRGLPFPTGTGLYPDPLVPGKGLARPGRNLQFWFVLKVPREIPGGEYRGELELKFRKEPWMPKMGPIRFPLIVKVYDFALPEPTPLRNTACWSPYALPQDWLTKDWLVAFYRNLAEHRQVPDPIYPSPVLRARPDGGIEVDSSAWEEMASFCLDELKMSHLFIPVWPLGGRPDVLQGVYFLWHFPAVTKQRWLGRRIFDPDLELTSEFKRLFGAYLKHMRARLKARGWLDRVYITTMDEPYTRHLADPEDRPENNFKVIKRFAAFVKSVFPEVKIFCTSDPRPELVGAIDHWCMRTLRDLAFARERASRGDEMTFCDNYKTFIDYPMVTPRLLGWMAWQLGARGWLTYSTMGGLRSAWEGPVVVYPVLAGVTVWGMGRMFYPDPMGPGLLESVRWEMMAEGAEDYEYLWLLKRELERLPDGLSSHPVVVRARELLRAPEKLVGPEGRGPYVKENSAPHRLRCEVGEVLEALRELRKGSAQGPPP